MRVGQQPKLDLSDRILLIDKYQGREDAQRCPSMPEKHGRLTVHANGQMLICASCDDGTGRAVPYLEVDNGMVAAAEQWLEDERKKLDAERAKARRSLVD